DPISLVKAAISIINRKRSDCRISQEEGDEIYCVYDVDDNSDAVLNSAKELAEKNGIKIFLSNPCFEIWFLLHFEQVNKGVSREDLYEQLKKYIKNYDKSGEVYHLLKDLQANAIANAERLNSMHEENGISLSCNACNPSTQVFKMIKYFKSLKEGTSYT
ncbi:MAG: RloB family protein, partial [Methanothrix sp.]